MTPDSIKENRKFGYTVGIALFIFWIARLILKHKYSWVIPAIAIILCLLAFIKPRYLNPVRLVWAKIGHGLGMVNTFILLILFYYLILAPLSLLRRLWGKDVLKLKREKSETYWENALPKMGSDLKDQF